MKYFYFVASVLIFAIQFWGLQTNPVVGVFFLLSLFRFTFNLAQYNRIGVHPSPKAFLMGAFNLDFLCPAKDNVDSKNKKQKPSLLAQLPRAIWLRLRAQARLWRRLLRHLWHGPQQRH